MSSNNLLVKSKHINLVLKDFSKEDRFFFETESTLQINLSKLINKLSGISYGLKDAIASILYSFINNGLNNCIIVKTTLIISENLPSQAQYIVALLVFTSFLIMGVSAILLIVFLLHPVIILLL